MRSLWISTDVKTHVGNQELPQTGDSRPVMSPSQRALSQQMMNYWRPWETNMQKSTNSRILQQTQGYSSNWSFTHNKLLRQQEHKTLIHFLWPIMTTCPSYHSKCMHSSQVNHRLVPWIGNLWDFSVILSIVPTTIGFLFHFGRFGFSLLSLCQFRH